MANICNNDFYATSENPENIKTIEKFFSEVPYADVDSFDNDITVYFESRWDFPEESMQELYDKIPDKEDIYMRCLSVEYGCLYHALWVCDKDGWREV